MFMRNTFGNVQCSGAIMVFATVFSQCQAQVVCISGGPVEVTKSGTDCRMASSTRVSFVFEYEVCQLCVFPQLRALQIFT